ncbi:MAG: hypothetical protein ACLR1T_08795 [Evtepia gabavorous]
MGKLTAHRMGALGAKVTVSAQGMRTWPGRRPTATRQAGWKPSPVSWAGLT